MRFGTYGRGIWDYQLDPEHEGCFPPQDFDGDGWLCDVDCDDTDDTVHPDAEEVCDGVDANCDPTDLDEGDADEDGFPACEDCDDDDASVNPSAAEICGNGLDEDCDGEDVPCADGDDGGTDDGGTDDGGTDGGGGTGDEDLDTKGGCGCSSAPRGPAGLGLLALLALVGLRRRPRPVPRDVQEVTP